MGRESGWGNERRKMMTMMIDLILMLVSIHSLFFSFFFGAFRWRDFPPRLSPCPTPNENGEGGRNLKPYGKYYK